eukprot:m.29553 g.29553  ORF g.29553 m.29553 type:complete len:711 (+) comp14375_c0_seq1:73-2205(+)
MEGQKAKSTFLPIVSMTLLNNGYCVFVRSAEVTGSGHVDLYFPREDMASVLKSLCLYDENNTIGSVSYNREEPQPAISLPTSSPLKSLVASLRGVNVKLTLVNSEVFEGTVLGAETSMCTRANESESVPHLSLLLPSGSIRSVDYSRVAEMKVLDQEALADLHHAVSAQRTSHGDEQRITVFYHGKADDKSRKLTVKYGLQCHPWRSSYRIVLEKEDPTAFRLDGFAVVENTLDEDWENIKLTLVAGAPHIALTEGRTGQRSGGANKSLSINVKDNKGAPAFSVRASPNETIYDLKLSISQARGFSPRKMRLIFAGKQLEDGRRLSDYNLQHEATVHIVMRGGVQDSGRETGGGALPQFKMAAPDNLSRFPVSMPVSAQRKQSAIVPLLEARLTGQQVVLYDEEIRRGNPVCALVFLNSTDRTLEGGTLQVMDSNEFLGEGTLLSMQPNDESVPIPYAVELGCEVLSEFDTLKLPITKVSIEHGFLKLYRKRQQRTVYNIVNKTNPPRVLDFMLNHSFLDGWSLCSDLLSEDEQPVDITDRHYQFRFVIAAPQVEAKKDAKKVFVVSEEVPFEEDHDLRHVSKETLDKWSEKKFVDDKTLGKIKAALDLAKQASRLRVEQYEVEEEVRQVQGTQKRLCENITALSQQEGSAKKYVALLEKSEDQLADLYKLIETKKAKRKAIDQEVSERLASLSFSREMKSSNQDPEIEK